MKQRIEINNVPYGKKLADGKKLHLVAGGDWMWKHFEDTEWRYSSSYPHCQEYSARCLYAEPWPIKEGWELVLTLAIKNGDEYWDVKLDKFMPIVNIGIGITLDSPPIIRKIPTEPEVFWGERNNDRNVPMYSKPDSNTGTWDSLAGWASRNGWLFEGFYLNKDNKDFLNDFLPWEYDGDSEKTIAQWAKFVKVT